MSHASTFSPTTTILVDVKHLGMMGEQLITQLIAGTKGELRQLHKTLATLAVTAGFIPSAKQVRHVGCMVDHTGQKFIAFSLKPVDTLEIMRGEMMRGEVK